MTLSGVTTGMAMMTWRIHNATTKTWIAKQLRGGHSPIIKIGKARMSTPMVPHAMAKASRMQDELQAQLWSGTLMLSSWR